MLSNDKKGKSTRISKLFQRTVVPVVLARVVLSALSMIAASAAINLLVIVNQKIGDEIVWFPIGALLLSAALLASIEQFGSNTSTPDRLGFKLWALVLLLTAVVSLIGLLLTGWDHVLNGSVALDGDALDESQVFRTSVSLFIPAAAGIVEEATLRGLLQRRVETVTGSIAALMLTGIAFVALHGSEALKPQRFIFLVLVALVAGILTARSKSVVPAALFHSATNFTMASVILMQR